jgi:hypothetical protein
MNCAPLLGRVNIKWSGSLDRLVNRWPEDV